MAPTLWLWRPSLSLNKYNVTVSGGCLASLLLSVVLLWHWLKITAIKKPLIVCWEMMLFQNVWFFFLAVLFFSPKWSEIMSDGEKENENRVQCLGPSLKSSITWMFHNFWDKQKFFIWKKWKICGEKNGHKWKKELLREDRRDREREGVIRGERENYFIILLNWRNTRGEKKEEKRQRGRDN